MNKSQKIFLLTIFFVSFILRASRLDYPLSYTFAWGDGTRDYLVASHIVRYGEFPLFGPYNLLDTAGIKNSPVYFYILSVPLLVYNHPLTLGAFNIFLQMGVLLLIFLIAKQAFDAPTALTALMLFSFNPKVIQFADYIWQPYLMLPLALLGIYLFIKGHPVLGMIAASLAFAIHNSAFPWLVALLLLKFNLKLIAVVVLTLTSFYLPVISSAALNAFPLQTVGGYLYNLNSNLDTFLDVFYVDKLFFAAILLLSTLLYRYRRNPFITPTVMLFLAPFLFSSFFDKIRFHYLILSSPPFVILTAYIVNRIKFTVPKLLLLGFLVWVFSGHFLFIKEFKRPLENQMFVDGITKKIVGEIPNPQTFQVKSYAKDNTTFYYPVLDTILLVPLEERLKIKLAKVSDDSPFNHVQINKGDQIILACYKFHNQSSDCREDFLKDNKSYEIKKTIHTSEFISVYSAKQKAY